MEKINITKEYLEKEYIQKRKTLDNIASQLGISPQPIKNRLREYKIKTRDRSDCQIRKVKQYHDKKWLIDEYLIKEKSSIQIAKELKISHATILRWMGKHGIKSRDNGYHWIGDKNPNYRGYIIQNGGYISDMVVGHPRSGNNNYVPRHVLVIEKQLGRYLTKEECVHHIDGNKTNNKIGNLRLFPNMSEHIKYEMRLRQFAKDILFTDKYPSKLKKDLVSYFEKFVGNNNKNCIRL